jgi:phosphate transport system substrate-binding protein
MKIASLLFVAFGLLAGLSRAQPSAPDLTGLPAYHPQYEVTGLIRNFGCPFSGLMTAWEDGFRRYQPKARFADRLPSSDAAISGLVTGVADLAPNGREPMFAEYLAFQETLGYDLSQVTIATGAFDIKGRTWAIAIFVNKDNPITQLTMKQLDGVFGSERTGAYRGFKWYPQYGRGAKDNIRTWGQLGLTGAWADKEIHTYGYAFTGMTNYFQLAVFNGGDKWNPNYREYAEMGTKLVSPGPIGESGSIAHMLKELSEDKYGIAWTGIPHVRAFPQYGLKPLALAPREGGPYFAPTLEDVRSRMYPLTRSIFMQYGRPPGQPLEPKEREFLRYILSRQGQEDVVRNGQYLPLTAAAAAEELQKLE